jgi:Na+-driven multidrug efflux pump
VRAAASSDVKAAPLRSKAAAPAAGSSDASISSSSNKQLSWLRSKWDKDIWQLAVPAALALAADPLLGMVDTALVGRLGSDELVSSIGCFEVLFACMTQIFDSSLQK